MCGIPLPEGLVDGSRLEPAIFTPSAKAEVGEHDENITYDAGRGARSATTTPPSCARLTLEIYTRAEEVARARGIILADTKVEFGTDPATGAITLGDEVLTPDSSRFWDADTYAPGPGAAVLRQAVRARLAHLGRVRLGQVLRRRRPRRCRRTSSSAPGARYVEAYERLTGRTFPA